MPALDVTRPASGAYCDVDSLIRLRFAARQLQLARRNRALSNLAGANKSNFRGRGIDFEEVRNYQPGDDIRTIDWRVTARTGTAHTKLFREERERPVLVAVDQRAGMFFGSQHCFKSVLAAQLAALVAWSALDSGDRVGGLVFGEDEHRDIRPRRSRKTVLSLLSEISRYNQRLPAEPGTAPDFASFLGKIRRVARPGTSIYLVSDFAGFDQDRAPEQLFQLAQHTEITGIACHDPLEAQLPRAGRYTVTDGQQRAQLNTASAQLRQRYQQEYQQQQDRVSRELKRLGIPLLQASTAEAPFTLLQQYYGASRR